MKCPFCQRKLEVDDIYCSGCDRDLPSPDEVSAVAASAGGSDAANGASGPPAAVSDSPPGGASPREEWEELVDASWVKVPVTPPNLVAASIAQFAPRQCPNCGAPASEFEPDGMCGRCFVDAVLPIRDDFYINVGPKVAGRSHRGIKHPRNEDCLDIGSVEVGDKTISWTVICDGVSQCTNPQEASSEACRAAGAVLRKAALDNQLGNEGLIHEAIIAAQKAVCAVQPEPIEVQKAMCARTRDPNGYLKYGPPACTIVVAYVRDGEAFYGWCGDSRIYTVEQAGGDLKTRLLTRDHTYLNWVLDRIQSEKAQCPMAAAAAGITDNEVACAEKYLGLKYQAALLEGSSARLDDLDQDVDVIDGMQGIVKIKNGVLHTMVQSLGALPEGYNLKPSFGHIKLDSTVCLFGCSDGVWNDVHPMEVSEAPAKYAEMYKQCGGRALEFACIAVNFASGADNNTCGVILL